MGPQIEVLVIEQCHDLHQIEIYDANVISVKHKGPGNLFIRNLPYLIELATAVESHGNYMIGTLNEFACSLSHLEHLILNLETRTVYHHGQSICEFTKLKQLELVGHSVYDLDLLAYASFIKGAPYLEKLVVRMIFCAGGRKIREGEKYSHEYLKEVEISGYCAKAFDLEFVLYLIENFTTLRKFVLNPAVQAPWIADPEEGIRVEKNARARAKRQLSGNVPPGIELLIL